MFRGLVRRNVEMKHLGSAMQPEREDELGGVQERGEPEQAARAERFDERAAGEIRQRRSSGPDDVVDAEHLHQSLARFAFAGERFKSGPGEAGSYGPQQHDSDLGGQAMQEVAGAQRHCHRTKANVERGEIAASLPEFPGEPRDEDVEKAVGGGEGEVLAIPEAELGSQMKEDVAEVVDDGVDVQPFEDEETRFELAWGHWGA